MVSAWADRRSANIAVPKEICS